LGSKRFYTRDETCDALRRLFQFGAIMMLIGAIYPLLEVFDRWDPPGLSNDTELRVYALLFGICLVLLLCKLISSGALKFAFLSWRVFLGDESVIPVATGHTPIFAIPPLCLCPLRI
jgi:peptidoglycan/LPS O-acetylase OafA/YrhL